MPRMMKCTRNAHEMIQARRMPRMIDDNSPAQPSPASAARQGTAQRSPAFKCTWAVAAHASPGRRGWFRAAPAQGLGAGGGSRRGQHRKAILRGQYRKGHIKAMSKGRTKRAVSKRPYQNGRIEGPHRRAASKRLAVWAILKGHMKRAILKGPYRKGHIHVGHFGNFVAMLVHFLL